MIDLNDSDLIQLEKVDQWAKHRQKSHRNIDQFTKDLEAQVNRVGFTCEVKVYDTNQPGAYAFELDITGRTDDSHFDPDKQVWEVTRNVLELPGAEKGFIKTDGAAKALLEGDRPSNKGKHHH